MTAKRIQPVSSHISTTRKKKLAANGLLSPGHDRFILTPTGFPETAS